IAAPAVNIIPIPDSLVFNHAASVPLVFLTAWHMLVGRAGIRPGQTVLVLGANSGVGIAGIQVAKFFNCEVITTAGDDHKIAKARELFFYNDTTPSKIYTLSLHDALPI